MKIASKTIMTLSTFGFINAMYITFLFIQNKMNDVINWGGDTATGSFCDINSSFSCTNVIMSPYAQIFGVPICTIALLVYPALFILAYKALQSKNPRNYFYSLSVISAMGFMFNLLFVHFEYLTLKTFCLLCLICLVFITINLIMSIRGYLKS